MSKKRNVGLIIVILMLLLVIIAGAAVAVLQYAKAKNIVQGSYAGQVDISNEVVTNGVLWLATAQEGGNPVEEFRAKTGEMKLTVKLDVQKVNSGSGNFTISLDKDEYDTYSAQAESALAASLSDIIAGRLQNLGIEEANDTAFVEEQIESALGMSAQEYVKLCNVALMPEYEMLEKKYAEEGFFEVKGDTIVWSGQDNSWTDHYILKDGMIVLTEGDGNWDYPVIFRMNAAAK